MLRQIRQWMMVIALGPTMLGGLGCGYLGIGEKGYTFPVEFSQDIPAAQGEVKVTPQKGGSQKVELVARHLPPPEAVNPQARAYVVWLKPEGARTQNVGGLLVNDKREAKFTTTTSFNNFEILVTSEKEATASEPGNARPIMRASVSGGRVY